MAMDVTTLTILTQIFYEPKRAFDSLKEKGSVWLPLVLLVVLTTVVMFWYVHTLDYTWMIDRMVSADADMKPDAREALRDIISPTFFTASTVGAALVGMPIEYALYALYYSIVARLMDSSIGYSKWFSFATWTSVPSLLTLPLIAIQIATSHGQISIEDLNMMSFNFLLFHLPAGDVWTSLTTSLSLTTIWTATLAVIGLRSWTSYSKTTCVFVALLPFAVVYGIWATKIVLF
jgi:hypothetical protein